MKLKIVVPIVVALIAIILGVSVFQGVLNSPTPETVSYTHLTLPTNREV